MSQTFRVALSGDFRKPDGSPAFPSFDTGRSRTTRASSRPMCRRSRAPSRRALPSRRRADPARPPLHPVELPGQRTARRRRRFGVGYDSVDVPPAPTTARAGASRPTACAGRWRCRSSPSSWRFPSAAGQGPALPPGPGGLGHAGRRHGRWSRRQDAGPARYRQHRCRGVPPRQAVRHEVPGARPLHRAEARSRAGRRAGLPRGPVPPVRLPVRLGAAFRSHAPHRQRRAAGADEAFGVPDQHLARAYGRSEGALPGVDPGHDPRRRPRRVRCRARAGGRAAAQARQRHLCAARLCWTDECFAGIGAADVAAVLSVMQGEVPRGIVNREIADNPAWRRKLEGYRAAFG